MRRRLAVVAIGIVGAVGFLVAPSAKAGEVCLSAHVVVNDSVVVDQQPCVTVPDAPALPAPPAPPELPPLPPLPVPLPIG